jgi:CDP-paratose 2-epimerase
MKVIITGGAGFIGSNAAARALRRGDEPVVVDNLSRPGALDNLQWLRSLGLEHFESTDLSEAEATRHVFDLHRDASLVLHLAGQVAVTSSVADPRSDFAANAMATLNVLEAVRLNKSRAALIYASTNKVYGSMDDLEIAEQNGRYAYRDFPGGIGENRSLDFHSPYGCSKGAADQYVRDYSRVYGMPTVVFRQSCIYGQRQWGMEDQGWIAWFTIASMTGRPITVYGDGLQVRDVLFVEDLLDAYDAAWRHLNVASGNIYNIGGGPENTLSLLELIRYLQRRSGRPLPFEWARARTGDQRIYVSNISRARRELGWQPTVRLEDGLDILYDWVAENVVPSSLSGNSAAAMHVVNSECADKVAPYSDVSK